MRSTERRRAEQALLKSEEQLRQSQKLEAVGRLAGGIAHDFNNLLSVILSYAEMLIADQAFSARGRAELEEIKRAGERAADLTRQMLAFSRQQVLEPKVIDLNDILANLHKMLGRVLGEDIELKLLPARQLGLVLADPGPARAGDHEPRRERARRDAAGRQAHDRDVERRARSGLRQGAPGRDAGTVRAARRQRYRRRHGQGDAGAASSSRSSPPRRWARAPASASPRCSASSSRAAATFWSTASPGWARRSRSICRRRRAIRQPCRLAAPPTVTRGTETILLVEDEDQVRSVASGVLRRAGYHVLEARSPGEAILACEQHPVRIDLLLTDVVMPKMSGRLLAERIAAVRPGIRILFMSGYTDDAILHHGVLDSGVAFLQKPLTPVALARKVRDVLDA